MSATQTWAEYFYAETIWAIRPFILTATLIGFVSLCVGLGLRIKEKSAGGARKISKDVKSGQPKSQ